MKKNYFAKFDTYSVVQGVIESERAALIGLAFFGERELAYNQAVVQISDYAPQQEYANQADMMRYRNDFDQLIYGLALLSAKLVSYARYAKDTALRDDVNYSASQLERMRKAKLFFLAKMMIERGTKVLTVATEDQLSAEDVALVSEPLASITKWKDARRNQQLKMLNNTRSIESAFATADEALADLFLSFNVLKFTNPVLFKRLDDAATVVISRRTISVKGLVAEAKTEYPIKGVKLIIRRLGDAVPTDLMVTTPDLVKQSAEKGGFYVQSLPQGTYLLTASKLGYSTTNVEFNVLPSETTRVSVFLVAS